MRSSPPLPLTVLCVLAFVGCFIRMFFSLSSEVRAVASWYPTYVSLSTVLLMVALYGLLQMKRLAFWSFLALFILHQAVQLWVHRWDFTSLLLSLAILVAAGLAYRRMD